MLDFDEVGRLMAARQCQCGNCSPENVPHSMVVSPLVAQLAHYSAVGEPLVVTPCELERLGTILQGQAMFLDGQEALLVARKRLNEHTRAMIRRIVTYAGFAVLWVSSLGAALWLSH